MSDRADRYREYAANARTRATNAQTTADQASARFAGGQPILAGHHSQRSAERDRDRSDAAMRRAMEENRKATYWERRARGAERRQEQAHDPHVIARRIERLEAEQRQLARLWEAPHGPDHRAQLELRAAVVAEQLTEARAELKASGVKIFGPGDFERGDFALSRGTWWEIKRVNKKSVTVGAVIGSAGRRVYRLADNPYSWTDTIPYTEVTGRKPASEME